MAQFLIIIQIINGLLPMIHQAVIMLEDAIPQSGQGNAKLIAIKSYLEAAFTAIDHGTVTFTRVWPILEKFVSATVTVLNATGIFKTRVSGTAIGGTATGQAAASTGTNQIADALMPK